MTVVRGVGPRLAAGLAAAGVRTAEDLALWPPREYRDFRTVVPVGRAREGEWRAIEGVVTGSIASGPPWRRRLVVRLADTDGAELSLVWFKAYPGLSGRFPAGATVLAAGTPSRYGNEVQIVHPEIGGVRPPGGEWPSDAPRGLVPVYAAVAGFDQKRLRRVIAEALAAAGPALIDPIPEALRRERALAPLGRAAALLHDPSPLLDAGSDPGSLRLHPDGPWRRLAYGEAFLLGVAVARARAAEARRPAPPLASDDRAFEAAIRGLGFALTAAQARAVEAVRRDLASDRPMRRLLQGDVGSGKTAVAVAAVAIAACAGRQAAVLAPTEILADQHAERLGRVLDAVGVRVERLSGGLRPRRRRDVVRSIAAGATRVVVGTHALLEETVRFPDLALVAIDEQQRFGVHQRFIISRAKSMAAGTTPHLLVMTATPIPRTLAFALYGDLDVTVLDELPPGRRPPATEAFGPAGRADAYERLLRLVAVGERAYVICPLVEPSDAMPLPAATSVYGDLARRLPEGAAALLHGRLLPEEKIEAIARFRSGRARVLVSTSVVEVGVDVPEASVVLVDGADRFGLSQLHQIRGRVGRDGRPSLCMLARSTDSETARARTDLLAATHDGFKIAEADLAMRGPGDIFGARQAGEASFRFADPLADADTIAEAVADARRVVAGAVPMSAEETARLDGALTRFGRSWGRVYERD